MKLRLAISVLALGLMNLPLAAEARGIPIVRGETHHLEFVSETTIPAPTGGQLSLCHRYETHSIYWVNGWSSSNGYVLSDTACEGTGYYDMPDAITAGFANGQIPEGVPATPQFSVTQIASGFTWPLAIGFLVFVAVVLRASSNRRYNTQSAERMEVLGLEDGPTFRFIDAMLHAANADGQAQQEEVDYIKAKAIEVTGLNYTDEHISWAITHTDRFKNKHDFERFGKGLTVDQKRMVLRAALAVVASDHNMSGAEKKFIERLTQGLKLGQSDLQEILQGGSAPAAA